MLERFFLSFSFFFLLCVAEKSYREVRSHTTWAGFSPPSCSLFVTPLRLTLRWSYPPFLQLHLSLPFFFRGGGGGGRGVEMFYGRKNESILITLKFNLLFPSPYERWTLWIDLVSRTSFRETLEISFELAYLWALYGFFLSCLYSKSWPCDHQLIFHFISALPVCQVVWLVDLVKKVAPCWSATLSSP